MPAMSDSARDSTVERIKIRLKNRFKYLKIRPQQFQNWKYLMTFQFLSIILNVNKDDNGLLNTNWKSSDLFCILD